MLKPYFEDSKPAGKLLGFVFVMFFMVFVWNSIGILLVRAFWDIDLSDPGVMPSLTEPGLQGAYQFWMFCNHAGLICTAFVFARLASMKTTGYLLLREPPKFGFIVGAIALMLLSWPMVNWLIEFNASMSLPESMGGIEESMQAMEQQAQDKFAAMQQGSTFYNLLLNIFLIALLPAIGEELGFRAIVQKLFAQWTKSIHWGIWLAALTFSFIHFQFYGFLPRMLLGALFGYLLIWSGTIWVPIAVHFFNNAATLTVQWLVQQDIISKEVGEFGTGGSIAILTISTVLFTTVLIYYRKNSRWPNIRNQFMALDATE